MLSGCATPSRLLPRLHCRHPVYMPEGTKGKLGDFPCYDPKKVKPGAAALAAASGLSNRGLLPQVPAQVAGDGTHMPKRQGTLSASQTLFPGPWTRALCRPHTPPPAPPTLPTPPRI